MRYFSLPVATNAELVCYVLDPRTERNPDRSPRPAVLIIPGGGYHRIVDHEQECIAMQWTAQGYHAMYLNYQVNPDGQHPLGTVPLEQAAKAMALIRGHSIEWNLDPNRIAVCGFSAGGHLAGSLGVHWHQPWLQELTGLSPDRIRPDALILCYSVITAGPLAHRGSIEHLLGPSPDPTWLSRFSLETQVTPHTPPCFLWHTQADEFVPVQNSLLFAESCIQQGIPVELHLFPRNRHGLSLANQETKFDDTSADPHVAQWLPLCANWLHMIWA